MSKLEDIRTQHARIPIQPDKLSFFAKKTTNSHILFFNSGRWSYHPYIIYWILADDTKKDERKGFLDLLKIPGMIILFLICSVGQFSFTGRSTMMGVWAVQKVNIILLIPGKKHLGTQISSLHNRDSPTRLHCVSLHQSTNQREKLTNNLRTICTL